MIAAPRDSDFAWIVATRSLIVAEASISQDWQPATLKSKSTHRQPPDTILHSRRRGDSVSSNGTSRGSGSEDLGLGLEDLLPEDLGPRVWI